MTIEEMELGADQAVSLLKAMANRHRLIILCCLQGGELSVGEMNQKKKKNWSQSVGIITTLGFIAPG